MRRTAILPALLLLLCVARHAHGLPADEMQRLLAEATGFFNEAGAAAGGDQAAARALYQKALLRFTRIAEEGGIRNAKLYYNIGNAHFHLGNLGRAILNYRRALLYDAGDANLLQNLQAARGKRIDRIEEKERTRILRILFFWYFDVPSSVRLVLFTVASAAFFLSAAARLFWKRSALTWVLGVALGAAVLSAGSLAADSLAPFSDRAGVILGAEVTARKGNAASYEPSFEQPLHEGTEFLLREERSLWYYIELADGRLCWIPRDAAELVR